MRCGFTSFVLLLLLALPSSWLRAQDVNALDLQKGFFDVRLGLPLDSSKVFTFKYQDNFQKKLRYLATNQKLSFMDVPLRAVEYMVYKNRLHSIRILTEGKVNSEKWLEVLQLFYGEGVQDGFAPNFSWMGKYIFLKYERNLLTNNAETVFISKAVHAEFERDYTTQIDD